MRVTIHPCPAFPPALPPAADEVRVWVVHLDRPPADPAELLTALTPDERDRAERYRAGAVRQQFVIGRGLLRRGPGAGPRPPPPPRPLPLPPPRAPRPP